MDTLQALPKPNLSHLAQNPVLESKENFAIEPQSFDFYLSFKSAGNYISYNVADSSYHEGINLTQSRMTTFDFTFALGMELPFRKNFLIRPNVSASEALGIKNKYDLATNQNTIYSQHGFIASSTFASGVDVLYNLSTEKPFYLGLGALAGTNHHTIRQSYIFENSLDPNNENPNIENFSSSGWSLLFGARAIAGIDIDETSSVELQFQFARDLFFSNTLTQTSLGLSYNQKVSSDFFKERFF